MRKANSLPSGSNPVGVDIHCCDVYLANDFYCVRMQACTAFVIAPAQGLVG